MDYMDIYKKRLNRYGNSPQERLEKGRELNFLKFLNQSPHKVLFNYEDKQIEAVLEPYKQDDTKTLMYLLSKVSDTFEVGKITIIDNTEYMFYYLDQRENSGYNRWILLKITNDIEWLNEDGNRFNNKAYIFDQKNNMLKNELKSRSRSDTLYLENLKLASMIMPLDKNLKINSYLTLKVKDVERSYVVTGFDFLSTPGIMYVSMDPTITRDLTPPPTMQPGEDPNDYFWLGVLGNG